MQQPASECCGHRECRPIVFTLCASEVFLSDPDHSVLVSSTLHRWACASETAGGMLAAGLSCNGSGSLRCPSVNHNWRASTPPVCSSYAGEMPFYILQYNRTPTRRVSALADHKIITLMTSVSRFFYAHAYIETPQSSNHLSP